MARGFIFSIDAFVAFIFILVMLHSLIFLSSVPSSYYGSLTQASYLARDTLATLTAINASMATGDNTYSRDTLLHYLIKNKNDPQVVQKYVGSLIPEQYGYRLEVWETKNGNWTYIYDTKDYSNDSHNKLYHKLKVSAYSIFFGYVDAGRRGTESPFCYISCKSPTCPTQCDKPVSLYEEGDATLGLVRLSVYR